MRRKLATAYAIFCTLLLAAGFTLVFFFAWRSGIWQVVACVCGLAAGFVLSPILHETGHIAFGQTANMELVYAKIFCFQIVTKEGKRRLRFASPFAADQTQMLPKSGGNMQKRARRYTLGGLLLSFYFFLLLLAGAIVCSSVGKTNYFLWGGVPYAGYLFFLNVLPLEYVGGKTDALVYLGIRKGYAAEKHMLSAMEIQGQLYEGKTFAEIDEKYYFDLPQLCEDEPLYALSLDLRYRYFLDKEDFESAADCLNRLASSQAYLSDEEIEKIAAELAYMHALQGDFVAAEESGKLCKRYLSENTLTAKRILAAYAFASGNAEGAAALKAQAEEVKTNERILGVRKFEERLLSRIKTE